jgi:hypothetical protein
MGMTAQRLWRLPHNGGCSELIDGTLRERPFNGALQGTAIARPGLLLGDHVRTYDLGRVVARCGFIIAVDPDTVLAPDIAFVVTPRVPERATQMY